VGNFLGREKATFSSRAHDRLEVQRRTVEVGSGGKKFEFAAFHPERPSETALVLFPALAMDGSQDAEGLYHVLGQKYDTFAFKNYGEEYSRDSVREALFEVMRKVGRKHVVLHGASFGAGIIYDLISDPATSHDLEQAGVRGAILETPALDKNHFNRRFRSVPDPVLISGGMAMSRAISNVSRPGVAGHRAPGQKLTQSEFAALLREKTVGRKVRVPVHVVFAEGDRLVDNRKTLQTLRSQCENISFETVPSTSRSLHHQIDYEAVWRKEPSVIERFAEG
jgi:hypothetical protein